MKWIGQAEFQSDRDENPNALRAGNFSNWIFRA